MSKSKARTREKRAVPENVALAVPEARANDDGFSYPIGENAEITDATYFCGWPHCPGYPYRASEQIHPEATCGYNLNGSDSAPKEEIPLSVRPKTEPHNEVPETPPPETAANDLPRSNSEVLHIYEENGGIGLEIEEGDSPVTADAVELPSPPNDVLPRLLLSAEERQHYLVRSSASETGHPSVGSCWAQPNELGVWLHCYEVTGVSLPEDFALCAIHHGGHKLECLVRLAHFTNGDLAPFLTKPRFLGDSSLGLSDRSVYPVLPDPQNRGLRESNGLNTWVPILGTWWLEELPSPQKGAVHRVEAINELVVERARVDDVAVMSYYPNGDRVREVAPFGKFLDGTFQFLDRVLDLPKWVGEAMAAEPERTAKAESPPRHEPELRADVSPPAPVETSSLASIAVMCDDLATSLGVTPSHVYRLLDGSMMTVSAIVAMKDLVASSPAVAAFMNRAQKPEFLKWFSQYLTSINGELQQHSDGSLQKVADYINKQIEPRLDTIETRLGDPSVPALEQLEHVRKTSADLYESTLSDMEGLIKRVESLEAMKPSKELKSGPNRARKDRAPRKSKAKRRVNAAIPKAFDDDDGFDELQELPKARVGYQPRSPKPLRGRAAAQRPSKKKVATTPGRVPPKRGRGRPKGSKTKKKTMALVPPKRETVSPFVTFMGNAQSPKILALLNRIVPSQRQRFIDQAKKGLPDLKNSGWSSKEQTSFARWYFVNRKH